jgi:hypothetical protein
VLARYSLVPFSLKAALPRMGTTSRRVLETFETSENEPGVTVAAGPTGTLLSSGGES